MKTIEIKFIFVLFTVMLLSNNAWSQYAPGEDLYDDDLTAGGADIQKGSKSFVRWINYNHSYTKEASSYSIYYGSQKFDVLDKYELFRVTGNGATCFFQGYNSGLPGAALELYDYKRKWKASLDNVNSNLFMRALGEIHFVTDKNHDVATFGYSLTTFHDDIDAEKKMFVGMNASSKESIRSEIMNKYNLFVDGGVLSTDYSIAPKSTWSDFVFDKGYNLRALNEVENYIDDNKHLPDVPSSQQVAEDGYSQHDINKVLLQKIEELTLYTIQQQKEIDALKTQLQESKK